MEMTGPTPADASFYTVPRARWSEPRQRLEGEINRTVAELERRSAGDAGWVAYARRTLLAVGEAAGRRHWEGAWALLLESRRAFVHLMDDEERAALTVSLRHEVGKAGDRRGAAMNELLAAPGPDAARLAEAVLHLDEALANKMRKRRSRRNELVIAAATLVAALAAIVAILLTSEVTTAPEEGDPAILADQALVGLSLLFGVAGACLSTLQRVPRRPWRDVPDERAALVASVVRPASGAASGLVALAAADAGLLSQSTSGVLLAAFAGGFTERFILRFLPDDDGKGAPGTPGDAGRAVAPRAAEGPAPPTADG